MFNDSLKEGLRHVSVPDHRRGDRPYRGNNGGGNNRNSNNRGRRNGNQRPGKGNVPVRLENRPEWEFIKKLRGQDVVIRFMDTSLPPRRGCLAWVDVYWLGIKFGGSSEVEMINKAGILGCRKAGDNDGDRA